MKLFKWCWCWLRHGGHVWVIKKYRRESWAYGIPSWSTYSVWECDRCGCQQ